MQWMGHGLRLVLCSCNNISLPSLVVWQHRNEHPKLLSRMELEVSVSKLGGLHGLTEPILIEQWHSKCLNNNRLGSFLRGYLPEESPAWAAGFCGAAATGRHLFGATGR